MGSRGVVHEDVDSAQLLNKPVDCLPTVGGCCQVKPLRRGTDPEPLDLLSDQAEPADAELSHVKPTS